MFGRILSTTALCAFVASIFYFFGDIRDEPRARAALLGAFDSGVAADEDPERHSAVVSDACGLASVCLPDEIDVGLIRPSAVRSLM